MKRRCANSRSRAFRWGAALNLLAAVLLVMVPVFQAVHLNTCHHHDHHHGFAALRQGHDGGAFADGLSARGVSSLSGHDHNTDHCPVCQALRALGQHFTLPEVAIVAPPTVVTIAAPSESFTRLSSLLKYSISPRAPPSC